MSKAKVINQRIRRANRTRKRIIGTNEKPRLSVNISHLHVSAQLIDDQASQTIASVTTVGKKTAKGNMTEKAAWIGAEIAKKAKAKKISQAVLDRGSKLYHGRVKALADAARDGGLNI